MASTRDLFAAVEAQNRQMAQMHEADLDAQIADKLAADLLREAGLELARSAAVDPSLADDVRAMAASYLDDQARLATRAPRLVETLNKYVEKDWYGKSGRDAMEVVRVEVKLALRDFDHLAWTSSGTLQDLLARLRSDDDQLVPPETE